MDNFLKFHSFLDTCTNYGIHNLPEDLQDPYHSSIYVTLWDEDQDNT